MKVSRQLLAVSVVLALALALACCSDGADAPGVVAGETPTGGGTATGQTDLGTTGAPDGGAGVGEDGGAATVRVRAFREAGALASRGLITARQRVEFEKCHVGAQCDGGIL